jgi:hypothetical protein
MVQQQVPKTLGSGNFINQTGSRLRFTETAILKNGESFGSFILHEEGDKLYMIITTDETGSVPFLLSVSNEPGETIRIFLFRQDETTTAIELVAE